MATDWQDALRALLPDQPAEDTAREESYATEPAEAQQRERLDIGLERKVRAG